MRTSTAFLPVTSALVLLAFLASADLELFRPSPSSARRETVPAAVAPVAPATPSADRAREIKRLHEATDCIDNVTSTKTADFASCLQIYSADYPAGPSFSFLYARRDARIRLANQAAERAGLWERLSDVVTEDERAPSSRADEAVRDALAQVRPFAGTASDAQRGLLAKADPIARAVEASEARRGELRAAAQHWRTRSGIDYESYAGAQRAITAYDHQAFSFEDQGAWETLTAADALVAWSKRAITAGDRAQLPIVVVKRNPAEVDYGLLHAVEEDLASAGFGNVVNSVAKAAVMIEFSDIRVRADATGNATRKHAAYDEAEYMAQFGFGVRLVWIGARGLPPEKIADVETDTKGEAIRTGVEKTAAAAVASFDRFTRRPPP